ncbi:MAG: dTDP-4-dehydrorhamnose 3,5-epimerase [Candidatus Hodarchaeales archaeon]|jgi:dTDP-4-dehydrorhamnose 3,5-epimerase
MLIKEGNLRDVYEIQLTPKEDNRGFFMRIYDYDIFKKFSLNKNWVQENHSMTKIKGTIRGFHFQFPPFAETKLIRVINGELFDVILDLRKDSPTFGKWDSNILSAENRKMLYIPRGFAHAICTLTDNCDLIYKVDNYFSPDHEGTIKYDDPELQVDWPLDREPTVSERDSKALSFNDFVEKYGPMEL